MPGIDKTLDAVHLLYELLSNIVILKVQNSRYHLTPIKLENLSEKNEYLITCSTY